MDRKILVRALAMHAAITAGRGNGDDFLGYAELVATTIDEFIDGRLTAESEALLRLDSEGSAQAAEA